MLRMQPKTRGLKHQQHFCPTTSARGSAPGRNTTAAGGRWLLRCPGPCALELTHGVHFLSSYLTFDSHRGSGRAPSRPVYVQTCTPLGALRQELAGAAAGRAAERSPAGSAGSRLQSALERGVWPHLPAIPYRGSCRPASRLQGALQQHVAPPTCHVRPTPRLFAW